eukprot:XP_002523802.2 uncharacterized protein LOC8271914 [Ricinus communis]
MNHTNSSMRSSHQILAFSSSETNKSSSSSSGMLSAREGHGNEANENNNNVIIINKSEKDHRDHEVLVEKKDCGRERLKKHREEVAGQVLIPDTWGQEDLLKDWIDCSSFDKSLAPDGIASARQALVAASASHHHHHQQQRLRIGSSAGWNQSCKR